MSLGFLDYELPPEQIAQEPLADRSASRMLHLSRATGEIFHRGFRDCLDLLREGDLLVMNDTRVTALRLMGRKPTGAAVEALLMKRLGPLRFEALTRPGKRLQLGAVILFEEGLRATVEEAKGPLRVLRFDPEPDFEERLDQVGLAPLPPYIGTPLRDRERYQTVYARVGGSAAAPTAGLHFTPELLGSLTNKGVGIAHVTLDVGLDTFKPIDVEDVSQHPMHGERCSVPPETVAAVAACSGRVVAVGTTSARTLESFATGPRALEAGTQVSRLFISPGYRFQVVDGMFTNFHMPRTTMLLMISALASEEAIERAYSEALKEGYRFLSFGDSMLIL